MLRKYVIILVVVAAVIAFIVFQSNLLNGFYQPENTNEFSNTMEYGECLFFTCGKISYRTSAEVTIPSTEIGFGGGKEDLVFGQIPKGSKAMRYLNIGNTESGRIKVKFVPFGNISNHIHLSANDFILERGDEIEVTVEFVADTNMDIGNYSGGVTLIRINPKFDVADFFLEMV